MKASWENIKHEYISTDISLAELAEKYKISRSTLYKRSAKEKWNEGRKRIKKKTSEKFEEKVSRKKATEEKNNLEKLLQAANSMASEIEKAMQDPEQFKRYLVQKKDRKASGEEKMRVEERTFRKYDARAMKDMTMALKELAAVIQELTGEKETKEISVVFKNTSGFEE